MRAMSHPQSYEILLVPGFVEETPGTGESDGTTATAEPAGADDPAEPDGGAGDAVRSAVVSATGETGASGYPRYAGDGVVADIDPATRTVEALLVDGAELTYGLTVRVRARDAGTAAGR